MISSFLTIVIPSMDSFPRLIETINTLLRQTRIKGTKVIIADLGSSDGSLEYAHQESFEFRKNITIFPKSFKEGRETYYHDLFGMIETPYVLFLTPGSILESKDSVMNLVNEFSIRNKKFIVGAKKNKNTFIDLFTSVKSLINPENRFDLIICRTNMLNYIKLDDDLKFSLEEKEYSVMKLLSV